MNQIEKIKELYEKALEGPYDDALVNIEIEGHTYAASYGDTQAKLFLALHEAWPKIEELIDAVKGGIAHADYCHIVYGEECCCLSKDAMKALKALEGAEVSDEQSK